MGAMHSIAKARLMTRTPELSNEVPTAKERWWVPYSSMQSRAEGKVSILACVETILAVVFYWWVAIRFETHWHLVSSVFIAPLLLLRSPESILTGVRWFLRDWFDVENRTKWPRLKGLAWMLLIGVTATLTILCFSRALMLKIPQDALNWGNIANIMIAFSFGVAVAVVTAGLMGLLLNKTSIPAEADSIEQKFEETILRSAIVGFFAGALIAGTTGLAHFTPIAIVVTILSMTLGMIVGAIIGVVTRSLLSRLLATLRHLPAGLRNLPENWRENMLLTDSLLPAELLPGIRENAPVFTLETWTHMLEKKRPSKFDDSGLSFAFTVMFFPAFLYRLNIKATAWFWWPLAFLLKPTPLTNEDGQRRQALCWPWTDPFQKMWIGLSAVLMAVSVILYNLNDRSWAAVQDISALPLAVKVAFAVDWQHIRIWHWMQWTTAAAGLGMLWHAGNARSQDVNDNWQNYCRHWRRHILLMECLRRVRTLATLATLTLAAGALLIGYRASWQNHVSLPANWIHSMEKFYQVRPSVDDKTAPKTKEP